MNHFVSLPQCLATDESLPIAEPTKFSFEVKARKTMQVQSSLYILFKMIVSVYHMIYRLAGLSLNTDIRVPVIAYEQESIGNGLQGHT